MKAAAGFCDSRRKKIAIDVLIISFLHNAPHEALERVALLDGVARRSHRVRVVLGYRPVLLGRGVVSSLKILGSVKFCL